jgi:hypothetical protein
MPSSATKHHVTDASRAQRATKPVRSAHRSMPHADPRRSLLVMAISDVVQGEPGSAAFPVAGESAGRSWPVKSETGAAGSYARLDRPRPGPRRECSAGRQCRTMVRRHMAHRAAGCSSPASLRGALQLSCLIARGLQLSCFVARRTAALPASGTAEAAAADRAPARNRHLNTPHEVFSRRRRCGCGGRPRASARRAHGVSQHT